MQEYCQSCAMPLSEEMLGTNADGSKSQDYCSYCFENGKFTSEVTMEEMIDFCVAPMVESNPEMTAEKARSMMEEAFPHLKRWAN